MKRIALYLTFSILTIALASACKDDQLYDTPAKLAEFTVTAQPAQDIIVAGQAVEVSLNITRPKGYKEAYFISYNQLSAGGRGTLSYEGRALERMYVYQLNSDDAIFSYTASSKNYHQLDFIISDSQGQQVDAQIIFNADKKGVNELLFSATLQTTQATIKLEHTVNIEILLDPSALYKGNYYIEYNQDDYCGLGVLSYNGTALHRNVARKLIGERIILPYKAITENYHKLDIVIFDEQGHKESFTVVFNANKNPADDYKFSASVLPLQRFIQEGETVNIEIKFHGNRAYQGKYYIMYAQVKDNGYGELKYGSLILKKDILHPLASGDEVKLSYKATSSNYHQLDIAIFYDERDTHYNLRVVFNEDKKSVVERVSEVLWKPYDSIIKREPARCSSFLWLDIFHRA